MSEGLITVSYLGAAILFILSLGGLAQETAKQGNFYGIVGITIAIIVTLVTMNAGGLAYTIAALLVGGAIGAFMAARVAMTAMPELVAILHSFVGLAAVLVGVASHLSGQSTDLIGSAKLIHEIEVFVGVLIGGITFTGSIVAFAKLSGRASGSPLLLPGRHMINLIMLVGSVILGIWFCNVSPSVGNIPLLLVTLISFVLGAHLVFAIGGADMPVVVSMLNSYSGWAAAATGFMLNNDLLIITGALVGSSGAILSSIMCEAMNRSIWNVIFGGFGATQQASGSGQTIEGEMKEISVDETAELMRDAKKIMIIPGYGMAVAQAQHPVQEITSISLEKRDRCFIWHSSGCRKTTRAYERIAEANVPTILSLEMDEINIIFHSAVTFMWSDVYDYIEVAIRATIGGGSSFTSDSKPTAIFDAGWNSDF
ncbi:MAG: NAD(P)(+) transhydrogenase (Re/Si-specific) subunit beta [Bdellovibrionota bacterium]